MAQARPQTLANHAYLVPMFHYWTALLLLINFVWAVYQVVAGFSWGSLVSALLALALVLLFLSVRAFVTGNQDRIIRLEERLRMERLLPDEIRSRVGDFTTSQLVALRFASDEELPDLARQVLDEGLDDRKEIKKRIQHWRADYQRV